MENLKLYKKGLLLEKFVRGGGSNRLIEKCIELKDLTEYYTSNLTIQSLKEVDNEIYPVYDLNGICAYTNTYQFDFSYISIAKDGSVGRIQICESNSSITGTLGVIKPINCQLEYLYYYLQTVNFKKYIVGTTIPHIYYKDYSDMLVPIPSIEEQNRIANLFSNLDKKIELETKKLQDLKTYKKGLLQKMFI